MAMGSYKGKDNEEDCPSFNNYQPIQVKPVDADVSYNHQPSFEEHRTIAANLTRSEIKQLHYVQEADYQHDMVIDAIEGKDMAWTAAAICDHKVRNKGKTDQHIKMKVLWMDGQSSWVRLDDLRLQDPHVISKYVQEKELFHHPAFTWAADYATDTNKSA
jgi:hypothetical protein